MFPLLGGTYLTAGCLMVTINWLDYSGAPALFLPEAIAPEWAGFFLPADPSEPYPDLELPDGRGFNLDSTFDFAQPRTHYDQLCAYLGTISAEATLYLVGHGRAVAISDGMDSLGWWAEEQILITGGRLTPPPDVLPTLVWQPVLQWQLPPGRVWLINACLHGLEPQLPKPPTDQFTELHLRPGLYTLASSSYKGLHLYRLRQP